MGATVANCKCSKVRYEAPRVGRRSSGTVGGRTADCGLRRRESCDRVKAERNGQRIECGQLADLGPLFGALLRSFSMGIRKRILTGSRGSPGPVWKQYGRGMKGEEKAPQPSWTFTCTCRSSRRRSDDETRFAKYPSTRLPTRPPTRKPQTFFGEIFLRQHGRPSLACPLTPFVL